MTRIFTDGAEMEDLLFWDVVANTVIGSTTPDPYDGEFYYQCASSGSMKKIFSSLSELYFRCRVYHTGLDTRSKFPMFTDGGNGQKSFWIGLSDTYELTATAYGYTPNYSGLVLQKDQWYLIEFHIKIADAGKIGVKVDGTQVIDFSGDTNARCSTVNSLEIVGWTCCFDDIGLNSTAGGSDDSWLGDGSIVKVYPDDNGAHNNWHGSDGNDVNNYALVSEFPADDDTTYVSHDSSSSGTQDQYGMSDYDGTGKTITRIYAEARARLTAASANTLKLGVLPSGSTDQMSAGRSLTVGAYQRVVGSEYTTNPADAGAWEEADIDAIEGVIEVG